VPEVFPIVFGGFVLLAIVLAIFGHRRTKKRREAMRTWATSLGLSFDAEKDRGFEDRFDFRALQRGRNRYAFNRINGVYDGRHVWAFDYHYETRSTRTSTDAKGHTRRRRETTHHYFSGVIVRANVPLQKLIIRPEGFGDRIKSFFGYDDLDFESSEYSRRFHVSADDRRYAYDVLHGRAIAYLLEQPKATIEFHDRGHVLILRGARRLTPDDLQTSLDTIDTLLDLMPEYLRREASVGEPARDRA
jgi:hypothetical protein